MGEAPNITSSLINYVQFTNITTDRMSLLITIVIIKSEIPERVIG